MDLDWKPTATEGGSGLEPEGATDGTPPAPTSPEPAGRDRRGRIAARASLAGALVVGGIAGAMVIGPAFAASPTPSAATSPTSGGPGGWGHGGPGMMGGHTEAVSDTSVAAKAIGISEADLLTALNGGQTIAAVAKAHNVTAQTVIDALVADGKTELAAAVKAGTITQAQADAEQSELVARATAQVNGTMGFGGPGGWH